MKNLVLCLFSVILLFVKGICNAQEISKEELQKYVSKGNVGTEFWVTFPTCPKNSTSYINVLKVIVFSQVKQLVTIEVPKNKYLLSKTVEANIVTEFILPDSIAQAYITTSVTKAPPEKIYNKAGVHITSVAPIAVYGLTDFGGNSEGFLAIPVTQLGKDYVVSSWALSSDSSKYSSFSNIVAAYDNTVLTFYMGGAKESKTTGGLVSGKASTWTLNEGDVVCFAGDGTDISGSRVVSDKPIGIVSGFKCDKVPNILYPLGFAQEMELPVKTWGKEYNITSVIYPLKNPIIRVYAHPDYKNIEIYRDGIKWKTLTNDKRTIDDAFFEENISSGPLKPFTISANAPIYIVMYGAGIPEKTDGNLQYQIILTPTEQYDSEIFFYAIESEEKQNSFWAQYTNVVYTLDTNKEIPLDMECGYLKEGKWEWRSFRSRFGSSGSIFPSRSTNGMLYGFKRLGYNKGDVFRLRAKKPFSAFSYVHKYAGAYGFPTGINLKELSISDTVPPQISVQQQTVGSWKGIAEDFITKNSIMKAEEPTSALRGIVSSICLTSESVNVILSNDKNIHFLTNPINWNIKVIDPTKDGYAIIVVSDKAGNYSYKEFKYKAVDTSTLEIRTPKDLILNIVKEKHRIDTIIVKNNNSVFPITITKFALRDTKDFVIQSSTTNDILLKPYEEIALPFVFIAKNVGTYDCIVTCSTETNRVFTAPIKARVVKSEIMMTGNTLFDTLYVGSNNIQKKEILVKTGTGEFTASTTITGFESSPNGAISFDGTTFGTEGFGIDTNNLKGLTLYPNQDELKIPVRFKPIKSGIHLALLSCFIDNNQLGSQKQLVGYGKMFSAVKEENSNRISVYTDVTSQKLVIQGEPFHNWAIYNTIGDRILMEEIPEMREINVIPIQNLPDGMYIFTTEINGKKVQEKFVIMR